MGCGWRLLCVVGDHSGDIGDAKHFRERPSESVGDRTAGKLWNVQCSRRRTSRIGGTQAGHDLSTLFRREIAAKQYQIGNTLRHGDHGGVRRRDELKLGA